MHKKYHAQKLKITALYIIKRWVGKTEIEFSNELYDSSKYFALSRYQYVYQLFDNTISRNIEKKVCQSLFFANWYVLARYSGFELNERQRFLLSSNLVPRYH